MLLFRVFTLKDNNKEKVLYLLEAFIFALIV